MAPVQRAAHGPDRLGRRARCPRAPHGPTSIRTVIAVIALTVAHTVPVTSVGVPGHFFRIFEFVRRRRISAVVLARTG